MCMSTEIDSKIFQLDGEVQNLVRRRRSPTSLTGGGISFGSGFSLGSGLGLAGPRKVKRAEITNIDCPTTIVYSVFRIGNSC